jgi:hypothetical protein
MERLMTRRNVLTAGAKGLVALVAGSALSSCSKKNPLEPELDPLELLVKDQATGTVRTHLYTGASVDVEVLNVSKPCVWLFAKRPGDSSYVQVPKKTEPNIFDLYLSEEGPSVAGNLAYYSIQDNTAHYTDETNTVPVTTERADMISQTIPVYPGRGQRINELRPTLEQKQGVGKISGLSINPPQEYGYRWDAKFIRVSDGKQFFLWTVAGYDRENYAPAIAAVPASEGTVLIQQNGDIQTEIELIVP